MIQQQVFNKYKENRDTIIEFLDNEYVTVKEKEKKQQDKGKKVNISTENDSKIIRSSSVLKNKKFRPNDFFIDISFFELNNVDLTYEEDDELELKEEEKKLPDLPLAR